MKVKTRIRARASIKMSARRRRDRRQGNKFGANNDASKYDFLKIYLNLLEFT